MISKPLFSETWPKGHLVNSDWSRNNRWSCYLKTFSFVILLICLCKPVLHFGLMIERKCRVCRFQFEAEQPRSNPNEKKAVKKSSTEDTRKKTGKKERKKERKKESEWKRDLEYKSQGITNNIALKENVIWFHNPDNAHIIFIVRTSINI